MSKSAQSEVVKLLWSGGWDSTFRLLQIILEEKKAAQPYYLIDPDRKSLRIEIKTMRDIKNRILKDFPEASERILPTKFSEIKDLKPDETLTIAYQEINSFRHLATQYLWFSWFCKGEGIDDMELGTEHKAEETNACLFRYYLTRIGDTAKFRIADEFLGGPFGDLFKNFRFPNFGYSKWDMKEKAEELGWLEIMKMTWFCHYPIHDRIPCGNCVPCAQAIEEGFAWRIPAYRRILKALGLLKVKHYIGILFRKVYPNFHS